MCLHLGRRQSMPPSLSIPWNSVECFILIFNLPLTSRPARGKSHHLSSSINEPCIFGPMGTSKACANFQASMRKNRNCGPEPWVQCRTLANHDASHRACLSIRSSGVNYHDDDGRGRRRVVTRMLAAAIPYTAVVVVVVH